jgi:hypothetical protein
VLPTISILIWFPSRQRLCVCAALYASLLPCTVCSSAVAGEKAALAARLARLKESGADELREKAELQEALVRCAPKSRAWRFILDMCCAH